MFQLPLVSVIIVNYNYGRFLRDSVSSVYNQSYKNIECFVVDNKSTDESAVILAEMVTIYPDLRVIFRDENEGQSIASAEAYLETRGQYIVFLDADDVLMLNCVAAHVFVNLSLYTHVGFTFTDMLQVVDDQIVLSTSRTQRPVGPSAARPLLRPFVWDGMECSLPAQVAETEVAPIERSQKDWCWTATSAFMFRRDAVDLFIHNPRLRFLHCAFDVYLARGINAIAGSVVIDRALCAYRMHRANIFSRHAQLECCHNYENGGSNDQSDHARREIIDHMFSNLSFFKKKLSSEDSFIYAILTIDRAMPKLCFEGRKYPTYGASCLLRNIHEVSRLYGRWRFLTWCVKLGVPLQGAARIASGWWSASHRHEARHRHED